MKAKAVNRVAELDSKFRDEIIANAILNQGVPNLYLDRLKEDRDIHPMLLFSSTFRSCSTFISNCIGEICGLGYERYTASHFNSDHELFLPALLKSIDKGSFGLLHMKATLLNINLINLFGISCVVCTRDIFQTIVSIAINSRRSYSHPDFANGYAGSSLAWLDDNLKTLSDEKLIDFIIDFYIPWHITFIASWYTESVIKKNVKVLWLSHKDIKKDTNLAIEKIIDTFELFPLIKKEDWPSIFEKYPAEALDQYRYYDDGTSREHWEKILNNEKKKRVISLTNYYPLVDFSSVGISKEMRNGT